MSLRRFIQSLITPRFYRKLQMLRRQCSNLVFAMAQGRVKVHVGKFTLSAPSDHILVKIGNTQPLRDLAIGIVARELGQKCPDRGFVDIGANIGDTAAIMATFAPNPIVAVEPSDFFHAFLVENAARIQTIRQIHKAMISGRQREEGILVHQGGTAHFERIEGATVSQPCQTLAQVANNDPCFVKIDTDGFDLPIIEDSIDFLARSLPVLYFEEYLTTRELLDSAQRVIGLLAARGYRHFIVFDDVGNLLCATTDIEKVRKLNVALFQNLTGLEDKGPYNYDVLCVSTADEEVLNAFSKHSGAVG
jgi:FkbM family methyltransferase